MVAHSLRCEKPARSSWAADSRRTTFGLIGFDRLADAPAPEWSVEFDDWIRRAIESSDIDGLLDFMAKAPAPRIAHPRTEHFAPLFDALGASVDSVQRESTVDGFWYGLSRRSFQFA